MLLAGLALLLAGAAAAANGGFTPVTPESPNAKGINTSYYLILALTGAVFLLVEGALVVFIVRFRSRGRGREVEGPQIRGNTQLELIWTVIPVLILAAIASFVFVKLPGIKNVPSASAAGGRLEVRVEGHQFYWQFVYPNGVIAVDRLRVPLGQVVKLDITSPDVNHSWWIPALGGKLDAIPGRTNRTWFRAEKLGVYRGQSAEFCGIQHAAMTATVEVLPKTDFERWLARQAAAQKAGASALGRETFAGVCAKCHNLRGPSLIGPSLAGSALLNDAKGITELLRNGGIRMPAVGKDWSNAQIRAVIAYLRKAGAPSGG